MAYLVQQFVKNSLLLSLTILVCWLHASAAETVHLDYTASSVEGGSMPDQINVTLKAVLGHTFVLHLQRDKEADPNVPVSTLRQDKNRIDIKQPEWLNDNLNIAYYQDPTNKAIVRVTRSDRGKFQFNGELSDGGEKSNLFKNKITKREPRDGPPSLTDDESYTLLPHDPTIVTHFDYINATQESDSIAAGQASKAVQPIFIDLAVVIDYSCYNEFFIATESRTEALQATREHYAFIMYGVDTRYRSIGHKQYPIRIWLVDLIIAETRTTSYLTENERKLLNGETHFVNHLQVLWNLRASINGTGSVLSHYDHAMLFTRYELQYTREDGEVINSVGSAYQSKMCKRDGNSVSLIHDNGKVTDVIDTVAHELGHSLGAEHDGEGNRCLNAEAFLMVDALGYTTPSNKKNAWLFSECSIEYFVGFIRTRLEDIDMKKCLLEKMFTPISSKMLKSTSSKQLTSTSRKVSDADQQCKNKYGVASILCMGAAFSVKSDICAAMSCQDPKTRECIPQKVIDGTVCGNGKECQKGECVASTGPNASIPPCKDTKSRKHCDRTLSKQPFKCFEMAERERCCTPGHC